MTEPRPARKDPLRILKLAAVLFACLSCLGLGYMIGHHDGKERALITEFKVVSSSLMRMEAEPESRLKDYTKAKYYFLANQLPDKYFPPKGDVGPVNDQSLTNITIGKEAYSVQAEYEIFKNRQRSLKH